MYTTTLHYEPTSYRSKRWSLTCPKWSKPFLRANHGIKVTSKLRKLQDQDCVLQFGHKIRQSRGLDGMIKHTCCWSKILIPVTNSSTTGNVLVSTPWDPSLDSQCLYLWLKGKNPGCLVGNKDGWCDTNTYTVGFWFLACGWHGTFGSRELGHAWRRRALWTAMFWCCPLDRGWASIIWCCIESLCRAITHHQIDSPVLPSFSGKSS